jgi:hypothetical protein
LYHKGCAVKSVRLDPDLQTKLQRAARALAQSQSEFIRDAVARRCAEVLGDSLAERLAPVVGILRSSGGRAHRTGQAFREVVARRRRR